MSVEQFQGLAWAQCSRPGCNWQGLPCTSTIDARKDEQQHERNHLTNPDERYA